MRREQFRMSEEEARAFMVHAPFVHMAGTDDDGGPVLRVVHVVDVDGALCFHAAPAGEKLTMIGKQVVMMAEEIVAEIPSTFTDPERACPATTLYRSVQVHGVLQRVDDAAFKARALQTLMERYQPEGGHKPITHDDPMYAAAVKGILVCRVAPTLIDGKAKLAQNKSPDDVRGLLEKMWARGNNHDARAVDLVRDANPLATTPAFLEAPPGVRLRSVVEPAHAERVAELLHDAYWNLQVSRAEIRRSHLSSSAWVGAFDEGGALIGSARALSDGAKWATIYDVIVDPAWRGKGVGSAVVRLLLDHPAVRGARKVCLRTRDAQAVYARFGFVEGPSSANAEMVLTRPAPAGVHGASALHSSDASHAGASACPHLGRSGNGRDGLHGSRE